MTVRSSFSTPDADNTELFVVRGDNREGLQARVAEVSALAGEQPPRNLRNLARWLNCALAPGGARLAIVADSHEDLQAKLARAAAKLADPRCEKIRDVTGVYYFARPLGAEGKIAFLFPGEGAQYLNMTAGLTPRFSVVENILTYCDEIASRPGLTIGSPRRFIHFPIDASEEERAAAEQELRRLGNAMFSVLVADLALFHLMEQFGLAPDMIGGHSAGELAALMAAGCMSDEHDATERVVQTMQMLDEMEDEQGPEDAVLLAVGASREKMTALLQDAHAACLAKAGSGHDAGESLTEAFVAMDNCPHQTVIVGRAVAMAAVEERLRSEGMMYERLVLSRPYHTQLFEPYSAPLAQMLDEIPFQAPRRKIYSCTTAAPFPEDADEIRRLTLAHWFSPVEFTHMVRAMHNEGARLFVEVGPRGNLTSFVEDILRGQSFQAIPLDLQRRGSVTQLHHALGQLAAHGAPVKLEMLYDSGESLMMAESHEPTASLPAETGPDVPVDTVAPTGAAAVMAGHFSLMEQFVGEQQLVMEQFLTARRAGVRPSRRGGAARGAARRQALSTPHERIAQVPAPQEPSEAGPNLPMLGDIVRLELGQEVVMRRRLDLSEDLFANEHTVGGRKVSKVNPEHCGLPIGPMTFTLELMAETAALLAPGCVAIEVKDVRLLRWLAYYDDAPGEIEATAKMLGARDDAAGNPSEFEVEVRIAIVDNGHLPLGETAGVAAVGRVVLAPGYPEAPQAEPFELQGRRPCRITLEGLYHDLFHGPLFMGVTELTAIGEEGIEGRAVVLPRRGVFQSIDDPQFLLDPVLLDVAMHPLCAWHLEQPDLAGRTLLPFEMKSVRIYGPRPDEGTRFQVRGHIVEQSPRHFVHGVEAIDEHGRVWCQLTAKYWRFYMPYGEVNFHGRKDEYFISNRWPEATPASWAKRGVCVRLEPPMDLHQPAMQMVTAQMTLSSDEMREYRRLTVPPKKRFDWVFGRLAAKDAVRLAWWERHDERFFPADLEIKHDEHGRPFAIHLGYGESAEMPLVSITHAEGVMGSLASFEPYAGIDLEKIEPREASFESVAFDDVERRLLDQAKERAEAVTRFWCAKEAVAKALGRGMSQGPRSVVVRHVNAEESLPAGAAWVEVELTPAFASEFPQFQGKRLKVYTSRNKSFLAAVTYCDVV
jgi:malonyl CoA-acyl carrier protein transacylase/phosphopantetheinyl transferase (holo-ACP synthase)